jgi:hypothetical protein
MMNGSKSSVTRRNALAGIGVGGLSAALAVQKTKAAQTASQADHPFVGSWMVMNTPPNIGLNFGVASSLDPNLGAIFNTPGAGTWEALDDASSHVTMVWFNSDADGMFLGSVQLDGYPVIDPSGQSWLDDGSKTKVTFRDASNMVTLVLGGDGSLAGHTVAYRMAPGSSGFPEAGEATPTA